MSQSSPDDFKFSLSDADKKGLPSDYTWFWKQTEGCFADADSKELAISPCFIAHDYKVVKDGKTSIKKAYAYEPSIDRLLDFIISPNNKNTYELIHGAFKPFFDIDTKVPASEDIKKQARQYLDEKFPLISKFITDLWGQDALPLFLDSSRLVGGYAKMSFHIIVTNRKLLTINDGYMEDVAKRLDVVVGGGVDTKVYSSNRVFRLPNASKYGEDVKLKIVKRVLPPALRALDDRTLLRKALVTVMDDDVVVIPIEPQAQAQGPEPKSKKRRTDDGAAAAGASGGDDGGAASNALVANVQTALQEFLDISGDSKTKVSNFRKFEENGKLSFQCINNGVRRCLLDPYRRTVHVKNNCLLFVDPLLPHFIVQYKCMSNCPAAHTYKIRDAADVGALVASNGGFQPYPGTDIATRLRMNLPPPLSLCRPDAPAVVQAQASASASAAETWEARIAKLRVVVGRLHVFDNIVFESLTHLAHNAPAYEKAFEEIFIDYYNLRKPKHMISLPLPWTMWAKRQALSLEASNVVIAKLEGFVAEHATACALRYAKGVLVSNHKASAEAALEALLPEYPQHEVRLRSAIDHIRSLKCASLTPEDDLYQWLKISDTPITSLRDPLDILRYIYLECQSYSAMKEEFEHNVVMITEGPVFLVYSPYKADVTSSTSECIRKEYQDSNYLSLSDGELQIHSFIDRWIKGKKQFKHTTMIPDSEGVKDPSYFFNTWSPFRASFTRPIAQALAEEISAPFFNHLREVLCGGNENEFVFFKRWLASIIQRPWIKTEIGIMLISKQGTGKNMFTNFLIDHLFGPRLAAETSDPKNDIYGRFSALNFAKSLIIINEANDLRRFANSIKDSITTKTMRMEFKGGKIFNGLPTFANYIFTTNDRNAIKIEFDDRRMFIPSISVEHLGGAEERKRYYTELNANLKHPLAGVAVMQMLEKVDLGNFDDFIGVNGRPITNMHKILAKGSAKIGTMFLSAIVNTDRFWPMQRANPDSLGHAEGVNTDSGGRAEGVVIRVKMSEMNKGARVCSEEWFSMKKVTHNEVAAQLGEILGPNSSKVNGYYCYSFSRQSLKDRLSESNQYIDDIELPEGVLLEVHVCAR